MGGETQTSLFAQPPNRRYPATTARIEHADCLVFLRSLPDESVDVITTDPAYSGMNQHMQFGHGRIVGHYHSDQRQEKSEWFEEFHDDPDNYRAFLSECNRVLRPNRHAYLMFDSYSLLTLGPIVRETFDVKNLITWDKVSMGMGHYFRRRHEYIIFATKGRRKLSRRDIPDVWRFRRIYRAAYPTQKPVEVFAAMLSGSAEPGFVVCDPFVGSGSSAIAALKYGCGFIGSDISEKAVALARRRVEHFLATGIDPYQTESAAIDGDGTKIVTASEGNALEDGNESIEDESMVFGYAPLESGHIAG